MPKAKSENLSRLGSRSLSRNPLPTPLGVAVAAACIAVETSVMLLLKTLAEENAFGVLYLIGVLIVATGWGAGLAAATAALSALAFVYFRNWPDSTMVPTQPQDWTALLVFVVVGLAANALARTARAHAADAEQRRRDAEASRDELGALADRQAALRRVATLVARGVRPSDVFPAVANELARSLGVANAALWRYESDGTATLVAGRDDPVQAARMPVGSRWSLDGQNIGAMVADSGQPARMDSHDTAVGDVAALIRRLGLRSGVGAPIVVEGRLWGVAVVGSSAEPLPPDTEQRIGEFTELVAVAVANAEAHAALTASRARIVTAADDARRRLERDLHDGAQQRLVSLALQLRSIEAGVPPELGPLKDEISAVVTGLNAASADLQELARGIHPAILSRGGLGPALEALARRCPVPVTVRLALDEQIPESAEVAVYYVVAEALTNAARHAHASLVDVDARTDESQLTVAIRDDGVGGADSRNGSGLVGLTDRVEALGGHLDIASPPGGGTALRVAIPTRA
ncbi:signal transduction histidine kinase [Mycobacterium europaeum]|uniref:histidine kinase n=1 Tax=Mycobacterium europaeum TaxID=761804 RepID=A0A0U1DRI5_9MYCO|nr:GAF domain-containing protein [Mycobacterium europaeum]CQD21537.1 signal transduction histidine kinase [Mycobacterium europaeum]